MLPLIALSLLISCSSDDDGPKKIVLPEGQATEMSFAANSSEGSIKFTAVSSWSAWTSSSSRASEEIEWLTLSTTHGSAGEVIIPFNLERNRTGKERTAYIIVVCEDETTSFRITQSNEDSDNPDIPDINIGGHIAIQKSNYINGANGIEYDGVTLYEVHYEAGRMVEMICHYRDDMAKPIGGTGDDYCETEETTRFEYDDANGRVRAIIHIESTYYPSKKVETEDSEHELAYEILPGAKIRALNGSYYYPQEGGYPAKFDFSYDSAGYLTQSRNDDGQEGKWDTSTFSWKSANLTSITSGYGTIGFDYLDSSLLNTIAGFDLNWALLNEFEVLDFAAGDITKIWAVCGFLGNGSKNLATAITETSPSGRKRSARLSFTEHSSERTRVKVEQFYDNEQVGYSDWEITYYGFL